MKAAAMPENAAGTMILTLVSSLVAPMAKAASRRLPGTDDSASSHIELISGRMSTPITRPADSVLYTSTFSWPRSPRRSGVTTVSAK